MTEVLSTTQAQSVRVTVRFHIFEFRKEADVALPLAASIGESLGELMQLVDAPIFTVPLQASTAGGKAIPLSTMLERTPLRDGSVLIIEPVEEKPAPVVRDAAEALAHNAAAGLPAQSATVWAGAGLLAASSIVAATLGLLPAAMLVALGAFILALWTRSALLTCLCIAAAAVAGWVFISPQEAERPWALWAGCVGALIALAACHATKLGGMRLSLATLTTALLCAIGAAGSLLPGAQGADLVGTQAPEVVPSAGAACALAATVILLAGAPSFTTHLVGLKVPQLPTAGQDLNVSDSVQDDVDQRADRAGLAYEGVCIGAAVAGLTALAFLAVMPVSSTNLVTVLFAQLLCVALAGATVLHAVRHARVVSSWALTGLALAATAVAAIYAARCWSALTTSPPWSIWVLSALAVGVLAAMVSTPLWASKVALAAPTTIAWCERAETLAIAACLPLAAHVAGIFLLIRGLG